MNFIEIMGHLGADAEVRYTPNGQKIVTLRVATNLRKNGKDQTVWWRVTIWGERFDKILTYLKKGSSVIVMGELQKPEVYTDRNGATQISLDITAEVIRFSPFGRAAAETNAAPNESGTSAPRNAAASPFSMNPAADLEGHMEYPNMNYEELAEAPKKGQAAAKSHTYTEDNIPF